MLTFAKEMQVPKTLQIENGDIIKLLPGKSPQIVDKAPSGRVIFRWFLGVDSDSQSIKERKNISINGYLEITLIVLNNGKIKKPVISLKKFLKQVKMRTFIFDMEDEILNICRTFSIENKNQEKNLIETIKTKL